MLATCIRKYEILNACPLHFDSFRIEKLSSFLLCSLKSHGPFGGAFGHIPVWVAAFCLLIVISV